MEEIGEFAGLSRRKRINFTAAAWERIFQEYISYTPVEMDYKGFVALVLALEHPTSPESIRYFWRVLDLDRSGRLTPMKIKYFYNAIHASLAGSYDCPSAAHVVVEVFDLLACNSTEGATLNDMLTSQQGHTVISMLLDVNGFWRYDNRESLVGSEEDEEDEAPQMSLQQQDGSAVNNVNDSLDEMLGENRANGELGNNVHAQAVVGSVVLNTSDEYYDEEGFEDTPPPGDSDEDEDEEDEEDGQGRKYSQLDKDDVKYLAAATTASVKGARYGNHNNNTIKNGEKTAPASSITTEYVNDSFEQYDDDLDDEEEL